MTDRRVPLAGDEEGHPAIERLAEYVDRVLAPAERAAVERHLASCAACRRTLVESRAFLDTEPAAREASPPVIAVRHRRRQLVWSAAGALAAAAVVLLAVRGVQRDSRRPEPQWAEFVAVVARQPTRIVEGRMTGGFPFAPAPPPRRGTEAADLPPELRIAAARIEGAARERETADRAAAAGAANAAVRDFDSAVASLERAVQQEPGNPRYQSDLSAVYLARAAAQSRAADYVSALAAAERALAADANSREACFNRALALQNLRRADARKAWERCLAIESDPAWADQIRQELAKLEP